MTGKRLDYVDALRGLAIIGVILTHTSSLVGLEGNLRPFMNLAGSGVLLFFVVSAFTIFLTFDRSAHVDVSPMRDFFIKRFMRIAPVYWLGIVLYTAVYGLSSRGWRPGPEIWHYPLHIIFMNLLYPGADSSVVPGGWSISCEMIFYITVPLWFMIIKSFRSALFFCFLCIVLGPLLVSILDHGLARAFSVIPERDVREYWYRSFPSQIGCFSFGIILFFLLKERRLTLLNNRSANAAAMVISAIGLVSTEIYPFLLQKQHWFAFWCMIIALSLSFHPWKIVVNRVTIFFGRVSYSAYILHFLVVYQTYKWLPTSDNALLRFVEIGAIGGGLTLPLAYASYRWIEMPTTRLGKRWIAHLETRGHSATPEGADLHAAP